jgi:HEAT repeat protein
MSRDVENLVKDLSASEVATRVAAAEKLNGLGEDASPAAVALVQALDDQEDSVRQLVNSTLEGCGPPPQNTVDDLERLLANQNADVAYWAATLLGRLEAGAVQAVESLKTAAAEHPSDEVQKRATWALGKIASG